MQSLGDIKKEPALRPVLILLSPCLFTKKRNLLPARKKLLTKLRERKVLVTDVGFTKKLMVANQRFETLQIKREFFTRIGEADIVELGKEYDDGF